MSRRPRANDDTDEGGFLDRWSRRKARAARPEESSSPEAPDTVEASEMASDQPAPDETGAEGTGEPERVKTDADMPDLDLIDESTDMSGFFSPGVSDELRNQALRRLFRMAKFNVTDGLDDYNEDFRNFALLGDIVTSDMRHRMEMDAQREAPGEPADPSPDGELVAADEHVETEGTGQGGDPEPGGEEHRAADDAGAEDDAGEVDGDNGDDRPDNPARTRT